MGCRFQGIAGSNSPSSLPPSVPCFPSLGNKRHRGFIYFFIYCRRRRINQVFSVCEFLGAWCFVNTSYYHPINPPKSKNPKTDIYKEILSKCPNGVLYIYAETDVYTYACLIYIWVSYMYLYTHIYTHTCSFSFWSDLLTISVALENGFYVNHTLLKSFQWQVIFYHWGFRSRCGAQCHLHIHISDLSRHPDSSSDHMDFHSGPWETRNPAITESRGN